MFSADPFFFENDLVFPVDELEHRGLVLVPEVRGIGQKGDHLGELRFVLDRVPGIAAVREHRVIRVDHRVELRQVIEAVVRNLHDVGLPHLRGDRLRDQPFRLDVGVAEPHHRAAVPCRHFQDRGGAVEVSKGVFIRLFRSHRVLMGIEHIKPCPGEPEAHAGVQLDCLCVRREFPDGLFQEKRGGIIAPVYDLIGGIIEEHALQLKRVRIGAEQTDARREVIPVRVGEEPPGGLQFSPLRVAP